MLRSAVATISSAATSRRTSEIAASMEKPSVATPRMPKIALSRRISSQR
jgi:hypothetical protein